MGIISRFISRYIFRKKPDYIMTVSPTPAGKSWSTTGKLISTPGTPATPGISFTGGGTSTRQKATAVASAIGTTSARTLEAETKARLQAETKARLQAETKAREEATKRKLSNIERRKLIAKRITGFNLARQKEAKLAQKVAEEKLKKEKEELTKNLYIEQRVVSTVKRKGKEIPIIETFIVDEKGKTIRKATPEERKISKEAEQKLVIPEELEKADIRRLERRATELRQQRLRGKADLKGELELAGLTVAGTIIGTGLAITQLPQVPRAVNLKIKQYFKDPKSIKEIPEAISRGGAEFGELLRISPTEAIAKIGTEILLMKGIGKTLKVTGALTSKFATKISSAIRGVKVTKRAIFIPALQKGKALTIKISPKLGRGRIPTQLKFGGKRVTAVSAQADRLVKFIKTRKIIRKPIPGEEKLTGATKKLLKKFDKGTINSKELIHLDKRIRVEAKKGLLERSFFADPEGVVRKRFLRLGTEKEASLLDTLAGDVTFKTTKPQILIFKDVKIEAFPKTKIFKSITKKLKTGKVLTQKEGGALVKFQLKKTGKFKPLGFQTSEMEITLAPGEIIKKVKTVSPVMIDGKRVSIVRAKVVKAKPGTKKLLIKARQGKITAKELKTLRTNLKKETKFTSSISDSYISKPRFPIGRKSVAIAVRAKRRIVKRISKRRIPKRVAKRISKRRIPKRVAKRISKRRIPKRVAKRKPPKRIPRRKPPAKIIERRIVREKIVRGPPIPVKPVIKVPKKRIPKKKPVRKPQAYEVWARPLKKKGQKKPKLIKVSKVPLSKNRAKDLRNYITDTSLGRTARIKPSIGKPSVPRLKTPKGYSRKTSKKFRRYRIKKGKRIPLKKGRVIEKSKFLLDRPEEIKQITLKRRIAQLSKPPKKRKSAKTKTIKRKKSPRTSGGIFG